MKFNFKKKYFVIAFLFISTLTISSCALNPFKPKREAILDFIVKNPEKSSIKLIRNSDVIADFNSDRMMPLASTVKIIIAIEYAEQSKSETIDPNELISISELDKYYVKGTDGNAHPSWLKSIESKIKDDKVSIKDITKGMIKFSSNANTEWLIEKLGKNKINERLKKLDIKKHSDIYYIVSAIFVSREKFPNLEGKELISKLRNLSIDEYIEITNTIHEKLENNPDYKKGIIDKLDIEVQRVWSDNLPASTTREYVSLMEKINSRKYFSEKTQIYLDEIIEWPLENKMNREWLSHTGAKGGSTAFVLTKALYATDKKGNKTELSYFFNDLSISENIELQTGINYFDLNILTNEKFIEKLKNSLSD